MKIQSAFTISAALLLIGASPAAAQSPAEFYEGKSLKVIAGTSAGSGYDTYARTLARHITVTADFFEAGDIMEASVRLAAKTHARLLFDPGRGIGESLIVEQFHSS